MEARQWCLCSWGYGRYSPVSSSGTGITHIVRNALGKMWLSVSAGVMASTNVVWDPVWDAVARAYLAMIRLKARPV